MSLEHPTTQTPDNVSAMIRQIRNVAYNLAGTKEEGHEVPLEFEISGLEEIAVLADRAEEAKPHDDPDMITTQIHDLALTMAAAARGGIRLQASSYHVIEDLAGRAEELLH